MGDYTLERSRRLEGNGYSPYIGWMNRSTVSVSEKGKTYRVTVAEDFESAVFQIDGEVINRGAKCDKYLAAIHHAMDRLQGVSVFIELKGKDISHAIDQLEATIKSREFMPYPKPTDRVRARIVTAGCGPKSSSKVKLEEARRRFKVVYNIELRVLKNQQNDNPIICVK